MAIRVFHLIRDEDESGVSGIGTVAEVFEASDGTVIVRWLSNMSSTNIYDNFKQVEQIHGHGGKTHLELVYDETPEVAPESVKDEAPPKTHKKRQPKK